ncbi:MAG TPA: TonB family protein [Acidobacteriaceae bacterium]|nr:TonB family protein [Acidobacteriaceae bacterium]
MARKLMETRAQQGRRWNATRMVVISVSLVLATSAPGMAFGQSKGSADRECRDRASVELLNSIPSPDLPVIEKDYLPVLVSRTKEKWYPLIPLEARPPQEKKGCVLVQFVVHPDGKVTDMELVMQSGDIAMDRAAWAAITSAAPYAPFPKRLTTTVIKMRMAFLYNEKAQRKEQ